MSERIAWHWDQDGWCIACDGKSPNHHPDCNLLALEAYNTALRTRLEMAEKKAELADWWGTSFLPESIGGTVPRSEEVALWLDLLDMKRANEGADTSNVMQTHIREWQRRYDALSAPESTEASE